MCRWHGLQIANSSLKESTDEQLYGDFLHVFIMINIYAVMLI